MKEIGWLKEFIRVSYQGNHDSSCLLLIRSQKAEEETIKKS